MVTYREGQRVPGLVESGQLKPGEYGRALDGSGWLLREPDGQSGLVESGRVQEQQDGTISVTGPVLLRTWSGHLELGVWRG